MLYTRFREIDDTLGELKNGELTVVAGAFFVNWIEKYMLYNLAKQADKNNRQNLPDYEKITHSFPDAENVSKTPMEIISVLVAPLMQYNVLFGFQDEEYDEKSFDLLKKQRIIFHHLPICQSWVYPFWRTSKKMIEDLVNYNKYKVPQNKISALCVSGWRKQIPLLKKVAQELNIPIVVFDDAVRDEKDAAKNLKREILYIDKLVIVEDNKYKNETLCPKTTTFITKDLKTGQSNTILSNYYPEVFFKICDAYSKNRLQETDCGRILRAMESDCKYINKYNFTKYMNLSREKNKYFWVYIEVFQRVEIEDLYKLVSEYKKGADNEEIMSAAMLLHKLLK